MLRRLIFIFFLIGTSSSYAGGNWAEAKIKKIDFNENGGVVIKIEWLKESGFFSDTDFKRFSFEYLNWPSASHAWFKSVLPWVPSDKKTYPMAEMVDCQRFLLNAYKEGSTINLGQMGTVVFQRSSISNSAGVVPFAKIVKQLGDTACLLYVAPI